MYWKESDEQGNKLTQQQSNEEIQYKKKSNQTNLHRKEQIFKEKN